MLITKISCEQSAWKKLLFYYLLCRNSKIFRQKSKEKETPQNVTKISVFDKIFSDQTPHFNSFDTTLPVKSYSTLSVKSSKPLQVLMTKARGITQMETVVSAYQPIMTEENSTYKPTTMEAVSELSHETTILATDIMQLSTG